MKGTKTFFLLLVVLGLGAYIWFYELNQLSTAEKKALELQAFDVQVDRVTAIGLRTPDYEVDLEKTDAGWELKHPKGARASLPVVQQLLARIKTLDKGELITPADIREKGQSLAEYGLSPPRIKLRLETPGQVRNYEVGDKNPLGNSLYVKEESTQNVMMVSTDLMDVLPESLLVFRDKTLFPLHEEEVQAVDLLKAGRSIRLEKRNGVWALTKPLPGAADQEQVVRLVQKLLQARIEGIRNEPSPEELESFTREGASQTVRLWSVNSKVPVEIEVGGDLPLNPDQLLLRIAGQEGLVVASRGLRALAGSPVDLFRDRTLFAVEAEEVREIHIEQDGKRLRIQRTSEGWEVTDPVTMKADTDRVLNMISTWRNARVEHFVDEEPRSEVPLVRVTFTHGEEEEPTQTGYEILDEVAAPGRVWLRRTGQSGKLVVVPDLVKYAPVEIMPYLSRTVLQFDPAKAVRLSLSHGEESEGVIRSGPDQPWTELTGDREVDQEKIETLLRHFSNLEAKKLLSNEAPADLTVLGGEIPLIRLSIGLSGEEAVNRTLVVHRTSASKLLLIRGAVQGQSLLFELNPEDLTLLEKPLIAEEE